MQGKSSSKSNENELLYRYISFPTFVDMVQTKTLNFVHPYVWEDCAENMFFLYYVNQIDNEYEKTVPLTFWSHIYAQSWSRLSESDAMWRIYSYDRQSLRITITHDSLKKIHVFSKDIIYDDTPPINKAGEKISIAKLFDLISQKRTAFSHEKEVRLYYTDYNEFDEFEKAVFNNLTNSPKKNEPVKCCPVSFKDVDNFIVGVQVNPFAPDWYVKTVKKYCELNNIPFEGKSQLYGE